jgi:protein-disulfide isomerase
MLARCAPAEKFFPIINVLFQMQAKWAVADDPGSALFKYVQPMGFTEDSFNECLDNQKVLEGVNAVRDRAERQFAVEGTPTFFFNGQRAVGELSLEEVEKIIDPLLKG